MRSWSPAPIVVELTVQNTKRVHNHFVRAICRAIYSWFIRKAFIHYRSFYISLSPRHAYLKLTMRLRRTALSTQLSRHDTIYRSVTQTPAMDNVHVYVNNNNKTYCGPIHQSRRATVCVPVTHVHVYHGLVKFHLINLNCVYMPIMFLIYMYNI